MKEEMVLMSKGDKVRDFSVVIKERKTRREQHYDMQAFDFSAAASQAYLQKHKLSQRTATDWEIVSLKEKAAADLPHITLDQKKV